MMNAKENVKRKLSKVSLESSPENDNKDGIHVLRRGSRFALVNIDPDFTIKVTRVKKVIDRPRSLPWNIGCGAWCRKYFLEGQVLSSDENPVVAFAGPAAPTIADKLVAKYRRPISMLLPAFFFHFMWWCISVRYNLWHLFTQRYAMSITMVFGSMIAGMTSEGGGAVAFPVMTLLLGVKPSIARDFSIIIQACGMMAATFAIFFMKVQIEWNAIILCSFGGGIGLIIGLEFLDPLLTPPQKKMGFVSIWFSFAFALFLLNRYRKRRTYMTIENFNWWKGLTLVVIGWFGGVFTSFAGSGLDICSFSLLTLLFRVSEKTATPTSVILMGFNSVLGAFWRIVIMGNVSPETYEYLYVCVPIVVIGAPFGSIIGSHFHRQVLAGLIYILDTVSLVTAYALVPQTPALIGTSVGLILGGAIIFLILTKVGELLMNRTEKHIFTRASKTRFVKEEPTKVSIDELTDITCNVTARMKF